MDVKLLSKIQLLCDMVHEYIVHHQLSDDDAILMYDVAQAIETQLGCRQAIHPTDDDPKKIREMYELNSPDPYEQE